VCVKSDHSLHFAKDDRQIKRDFYKTQGGYFTGVVVQKEGIQSDGYGFCVSAQFIK